ncbi:MAG: undecaprenyl-phosphate galactose phosphotransferase WbaP [Planctomycetota bacterium]
MSSIELENRSLPVGVVSADAIEQLDPFVPLSDSVTHDAMPVFPAESSDSSPATRSLPGADRFQFFCTTAPLVLADAFALLVSVLAAAGLIIATTPNAVVPTLGNQLLVVCAGYFLFGIVNGVFPGSGTSPVVELKQSVLAVWASFGLMLVLNLTLAVLSSSEILLGVIGVSFATVFVPLIRMVGRKVLSRTGWWGERTLIVGAGPQGRALYRFYSRAPERGLRPIGVVDSLSVSEHVDSGIPYLGSVSELERLRRRYNCRWVIVAPGGCEQMDVGQVMAKAADVPNLLILPSQFLLPSLWATTRECAGVLGVHLRDNLQDKVSLVAKRLIDITLASTAMLLLSPLFLLIVVWVKWKSPGSAFYGHTRIGRGGKLFKAWKFRSMVMDADKVLESWLEKDPEMRRQWIEDQKLKKDPRIIPGIGGFIRKTSVDELPQLWNVILGDMSLVGPRPIVKNEIDRYREMYPLYLRVRPGITGLWQVSGRNDTSYEHRVRLDSYYVCNWSNWLDAYIAIRTVRTILLREGAY